MSKLERGEQGIGQKSLMGLMRALSVNESFLKGESDRITCYSETEEGLIPNWLTKADYMRKKALGLIQETIINPEPVSEQEAGEWREKSLDWEEAKDFWERPCIKRLLLPDSVTLDEENAGLINEASSLLMGMSRQQLEKTLLIIKEVILK